MSKTWKRNQEDYDDLQTRESRKEIKARKRRHYEESEYASHAERRK